MNKPFRILMFLVLLSLVLVPGTSQGGDLEWQHGFESCVLDSYCDYLDTEPVCDSAPTCQGSQAEGICLDSVCLVDPIENDSGCEGMQSADCGAYAPVFCTSEQVQTTNQAALCATSCSNNNDCAAGYSCDGSFQCVSTTCGDGLIEGGEVCDDFNDLACGTCSADCRTVQNPTFASGSIMTIEGSSLVDGETFVLNDGINAPTTFEFDHVDAMGTSGVAVPFDDTDSASVVKNSIISAINAFAGALGISAAAAELSEVALVGNFQSGLANQPIVETVADPGFVVQGMDGGAARDCPAFTGCLVDDDCASESCTANVCDP